MEETLTLQGNRDSVFAEVEGYLKGKGYNIVAKDFGRPWGGYFVIDETQSGKFGAQFFPGIDINSLRVGNGKLSPKVLLVEAGKRLSWQYHHRRSEIWKLAFGTAAVVTSQTDQEREPKKLQTGEIIRLHQGERHRLVGLDGWGMIAEIWQHTDPSQPSDEDDIVRVQDDFGRGA